MAGHLAGVLARDGAAPADRLDCIWFEPIYGCDWTDGVVWGMLEAWLRHLILICSPLVAR